MLVHSGEIIPQAACKRYGLAIGANSAWFVRILIWTCAIVAYPIAKMLDWILGEQHTALFRRAELKALVDIHKEGTGFGGQLSENEVRFAAGRALFIGWPHVQGRAAQQSSSAAQLLLRIMASCMTRP